MEKFTELDWFKLKTIEKIVSDCIGHSLFLDSDDVDKMQKIGYIEGIFDSIYAIVALKIKEDKKILNE